MNMEDVSTAVKKHLDAQHVPIKYWQWDDKTVVLAMVTAKEGAAVVAVDSLAFLHRRAVERLRF